MKNKENEFKFEHQKMTVEEIRKAVKEEIKDFVTRFEATVNCQLPETELIYAHNEIESLLYCGWCSKDYYNYFDDDTIKEMKYCPFCGAKIIGKRESE